MEPRLSCADVLAGTAGWAIPKAVRARFPGGASQLERYAARFGCVEINSSFYRSHRAATYVRWAASVPAGFRFSLKIPKAISHAARLVACEHAFEAFLHESANLGAKRAVLLLQLPPSFAFDAGVARTFFTMVRDRYDGMLACEPRHATWFASAANGLLQELQIARVAADPARAPGAAVPGGWDGFAYYRWHGSPRTYYSEYGEEGVAAFVDGVCSAGRPAWCIFDNTALGAATTDALAFTRRCVLSRSFGAAQSNGEPR